MRAQRFDVAHTRIEHRSPHARCADVSRETRVASCCARRCHMRRRILHSRQRDVCAHAPASAKVSTRARSREKYSSPSRAAAQDSLRDKLFRLCERRIPRIEKAYTEGNGECGGTNATHTDVSTGRRTGGRDPRRNQGQAERGCILGAPAAPSSTRPAERPRRGRGTLKAVPRDVPVVRHRPLRPLRSRPPVAGERTRTRVMRHW